MDEQFDELELSVDDEKPTMSGGRLRRVLSRWWLILLCVILGGIGGFYRFSITPSVLYTAMGIMEIPGLKQQLVGDEALVDRRGDLQKVNTLISKLGGVSALGRVANSDDVQALERVVPPPASWKPRYMLTEDERSCSPASSIEPIELQALLGGWVAFEQREGTAMIDVRVTHYDREAAITISKAIMENYIDQAAIKRIGGLEATFEILSNEAVEASLELETLEKSLKIYESALTLSEEVSQKRAELAQLRARYKSKHPKMMQAVSINNDLFQRFQTEIKYIANSMEEAAYWKPRMAEIESLEARIAIGGASVPKVKQEWVTLVQNALAARASLLRTKLSNKSSIFSAITQRLSEIDVTEGADSNDVVIAEMPVIMGVERSSPNQSVILGLALGLVVGVGFSFLLSTIDYKVYDVLSAEEACALSCLAALPENELLRGSNSEWDTVLKLDSNGPHAESIRNLRAAILLLGRRENNQVIMVTSAAPSEGKTTVSGELATALAMNDERVALVDLDLRKPRVHKLFRKVENQPGVSELFTGQATMDDVLHNSRINKLSIIGAGAIAPNPADLLSENELTRLISALRNQFDRIIIDTPPVLPVADARVISSYVDKVILVVRASCSPIGAIMRAKQLLQDARAPMAGIVVNALSKKKNFGSYKGYKGYGEYGSRGGYAYYSDK